MVLAKGTGKEKVVTVVPLHEELKPGTLLGVLELARITRKEFVGAYQRDPMRISHSIDCGISVSEIGLERILLG